MVLNTELVFSVVVLLLGLCALLVFAVAQFGAQVHPASPECSLAGQRRRAGQRPPVVVKRAVAGLVVGLGARMPLFNSSQRREMRGKLVSAGYRQSGALPVLLGMAAFCGLLVVLAAVTLVWPRLGDGQTLYKGLSLVLAMYLGAMAPRIVVDKLVAKRQRAISDSFSDALDLVVVCANAGWA